MLAQGNNLRLRDQGGSRGRSRNQDQKTRTISTCWSNPGGLSLRRISQRIFMAHFSRTFFGRVSSPGFQASPENSSLGCFLAPCDPNSFSPSATKKATTSDNVGITESVSVQSLHDPSSVSTICGKHTAQATTFSSLPDLHLAGTPPGQASSTPRDWSSWRLSGTGDSQRDSRESFAIETPTVIARQADSPGSLEFPIRAN